ncbi:DoxX family protein [Dokdonia sp. Hel_I_53]|uniref:DoxX family protein n=1 Tax=Dokdonia sp. Hel_I_53 TaxID=1566287 RepID=UPI00119AE650|nr:DoxX family protein [Dokdonia sp. Hel_I_53]TVZ51563.1 putative membrane protein [Dokdonia sp. Hel_I_53]
MPWHLYLMAAIYIIAGTMHFITPKVYGAIMPSYIPNKRAMVFWSGIAEIAGGVGLLFEETRAIAVWGIIVMLIIFFTVHIDMLSNERLKGRYPKWLLWARIPLQFGLIYWAYIYLP